MADDVEKFFWRELQLALVGWYRGSCKEGANVVSESLINTLAVQQIQNFLTDVNFRSVIKFVKDKFVVRNIVADGTVATLI